MVKKSMILGMMLALGLFFIGFSPQGLAEEKGLVGWWKFDEGEGTIAKDSSGNGNDGTIKGPIWVKDGLEFDGKNDYVLVPASESLDITEQITILAWVELAVPNKGSYNNVIRAGSVWFFGATEKTKVHFLVYNDTARFPAVQSGWNITCYSKNCLKPDTFSQIAGTYNSETGIAKVYANGELVGKKTGEDVVTPSPGSFYIGNRPGFGPYGFHGTIKEVKIYNRVLSDEEIKKCYDRSNLL